MGRTLSSFLEDQRAELASSAPQRDVRREALGKLVDTLLAGGSPRDLRGTSSEAVTMALDLAEKEAVTFTADEVRRLLALATAPMEPGPKPAALMSDAALTAGSVGVFLWDIPSDRLYGDVSFSRLFDIELDATGAAPLSDYVAAIHPDDRVATTAKIQKTIDEGGLYEAEYRIVTKGGERWVVARGRVDRDEHGRALRFPGVLMDITDRKRAEHAEREARAEAESERAKLTELFMQAPVGICITEGAEHVFTFANPAALALVGGRELVGKPLLRALPEMDGQGFNELLARVMMTGEPFTASAREAKQLREGQLETGWYDIVYAPKRRPDGTIDGVLHCTFDVTEQVLARRRTEVLNEQLRLAEEYRRRVLEASGAGLVELDVLSGAVMADTRATKLLGVAPERALTLDAVLARFPFDEDRVQAAAAIDAAIGGKNDGRCQIEVRIGGDGTTPLRWVEGRGQVTFDARGRALRLPGVIIDVTARKQAEREREEARIQVSEVLEQMNEAFFSMTPDFRITRVNRRYEELSRRSREEVVGRVLWELFPEGAGPTTTYAREYRRCMTERVPTEFVDYDAPLDLWAEVHAYPTSDGGVSAVFRDVTAQKRAELALQASEERYRTLFESIDDAYCLIQLVVDADGKTVDYLFLETNKKFGENTGLENAVGKTIRELVPGISESWFEIYGRVAETGEMARFENHDPALHRWFDAFANRVGPPERRQVAIVFKDITARRRAEGEREAALQREQAARAEADAQRQQQHDLFMQAAVAIAILDGPEHVYTFANAPYRALVNGRDVVGKPLHVALADVKELGFDKLLDGVMATGTPFVATEMPIRLEHHKGEELLYLNFTYAPKRNTNGVIDGVLVTAIDVTDLVLGRNQAEEASRVKDEFLATISHELRTPLTAMLGWVQMLRAGVLPPERHAHALETIERNARAQTRLIEDLLDMGRILAGKLTLELQPVDLGAVVESALESIRPAASAKGIDVQAVVDTRRALQGDPNRLQQIIWNLLTNAVKFTPRGGRVHVLAQEADSAIELSVVDTGQGIPASFVPHVFERFRQAEGGNTRTKGGLGLGLSIVKQLAEMHGGSVSAFSAGEGEGATFTLRLPVETAPDREPESTSAPSRGGAMLGELAGLHVLVVDDDDDTREMLAALLEMSGASVRAASSPSDARLALADERPDIVISDIGMPGESGLAFMASIRGLASHDGRRIPAIALSAYARSGDQAEALKAGFDKHMAKPVQPDDLVATVLSLARPRVPASRPRR